MTHIENAVIVVAHPDDEIIWFSSILNQCKNVLVCFGPSATSKRSWDDGRAKLMETYPLTKVKFLRVRQSDALGAANWKKPKVSDSGLQLRRRARPLYERNAQILRSILEAELQRDSVVFTHNPWGEYGHEEHVQVFRVLAELRETLGFELYVNSYVSDRSATLMSRYSHSLGGDPLLHKTNPELALSLKNLYLQHDCWTWMADYQWPRYESFYRLNQPDARNRTNTSASLPMNYVTHQFNQSPIRAIARKIVPETVKSYIKRGFDIG